MYFFEALFYVLLIISVGTFAGAASTYNSLTVKDVKTVARLTMWISGLLSVVSGVILLILLL